jgi:hypothetical protein
MTSTQQGLTFCFQYNDPLYTKNQEQNLKEWKKAGKLPPPKKKPPKQKVKLGTYLPPFCDKMCRNGSVTYLPWCTDVVGEVLVQVSEFSWAQGCFMVYPCWLYLSTRGICQIWVQVKEENRKI